MQRRCAIDGCQSARAIDALGHESELCRTHLIKSVDEARRREQRAIAERERHEKA